MSRQDVRRLVLFGGIIAMLVVTAVVDDGDRGFAVMTLAALAFSYGLALRQQRNEHEPDESPSNLQLLAELHENRSVVGVAMLCLLIGLVVLNETGPVMAVFVSLGVVSSAFLSTRRILARQGIERDQFLLATSAAFAATMAACGVWAMFEAFADAPTLDPGAVWVFGAIVWAVANTVVARRAA